VHWVL